MRILLCLLSEQHVPNLLSVHHFQPDRLVLVETEKMKRDRAVEHLIDALKRGGRDYSERCERVPLTQEDSAPETVRALKAAYGRHPSDDWVVNVTGGTKPMSIAAYQFFHALGATCVYINHSKPNIIQWMDGARVETCDHPLTIAEFLEGYGYVSRKTPEKVAEAETRARAWWPCARALATHSLPQDLLAFDSRTESDRARDGGLALEPRHLAPALLAAAPVLDSLAETFGLARPDGGLTGKLKKHQVQFLTGGWLEVFVWNLLDQNQAALGLQDVRLGMEPSHRGSAVSNDFDVAFMHRHGLWMVECKSGAQEHDPDAGILYRIEAIIRQFRALHARTILATTADNVLDPKTGAIKKALQDRARAYQCTIVARDQVRALALTDDPADLLKSILGL